ncbi:MAG: endospore germination permease, partial [Bacillota bacterium]|nr:endospore germination permease [Bacillota bacterium]
LYTIRKGIEVIVNTGFVLTMLTIIIGVFISVVTVGEMNLSNFLPLFQMNLKDFVQGINLMVAIPFGDTVVFLMIYPYVNEIRQVKKSALLGLILGGMYFLSVAFRNIGILGELAFTHGFPSYQVAALINIGEFISRMEALIAVIMLFNVFLKICIFYYATALSAAQFLKLRSYKPLVSLIGIISIVLSLSVVSSPERESYILTNIYPIYAIPFVILFPIISLTIAFIKEKIA